MSSKDAETDASTGSTQSSKENPGSQPERSTKGTGERRRSFVETVRDKWGDKPVRFAIRSSFVLFFVLLLIGDFCVSAVKAPAQASDTDAVAAAKNSRSGADDRHPHPAQVDSPGDEARSIAPRDGGTNAVRRDSDTAGAGSREPANGVGSAADSTPSPAPNNGVPLVIYLAVDISGSMQAALGTWLGQVQRPCRGDCGTPGPQATQEARAQKRDGGPISDVLASLAQLGRVCKDCQLRVLAFAEKVRWVNHPRACGEGGGQGTMKDDERSERWSLTDAAGDGLKTALNNARACAADLREKNTHIEEVAKEVHRDWLRTRKEIVNELRRMARSATSADTVQDRVPQPVLVILSDGIQTHGSSARLAGDPPPALVVPPNSAEAVSREFARKLDIASLSARVPFLVLVQGPSRSPRPETANLRRPPAQSRALPGETATPEGRLRRENPSAWVRVAAPFGRNELDVFFRDAGHPPWQYVEIGDTQHVRVEPGYPAGGQFGRKNTAVRAGLGFAVGAADRRFGWHAANLGESESPLAHQGVRIRLDAMVLLVRTEDGCDDLLKALWAEDSEVKRLDMVKSWTEQGVCLNEERLDDDTMMSWQLSPDIAQEKCSEHGWISLVQNTHCKNNMVERGRACFLTLTEAGASSAAFETRRTGSWARVSKVRLKNLHEPPLFANADPWTFRTACVANGWGYAQDVCTDHDPLRMVVVEREGDELREWSDRSPEVEQLRKDNGECSITASWVGPPDAGAMLQVTTATGREQNCDDVQLSVSPGSYLAQYGEPRRTTKSLSLTLHPKHASVWAVESAVLAYFFGGLLVFGLLAWLLGYTNLARSLLSRPSPQTAPQSTPAEPVPPGPTTHASGATTLAELLPSASEAVNCVTVGLIALFVWRWYGPTLGAQPTLPVCAAHVAFLMVCLGTGYAFAMCRRKSEQEQAKDETVGERPWLLLLIVAPHLLLSLCFLYHSFGHNTSLMEVYRDAFLEPSRRAMNRMMLRPIAIIVMVLLLLTGALLWRKRRGNLKISLGDFQGCSLAAVLAGILLVLPTLETLAVEVGRAHPESMPLIRRCIEAFLAAAFKIVSG
jgi:hypothetical protein